MTLPGLRVGGDLEFYLPQSESFFGESFTSRFMALNANAQYFFLDTDAFEVYGLGGLSLGRASVSIGGESESNTEIDINLGAGLEVPMDFGRIYGEVKLVVGDYDRIVIGAGVRIGL